MLGPLAQHEAAPFEGQRVGEGPGGLEDFRRGADEHLLDAGLGVPSRLAQGVVHSRDDPPTQDAQPLLAGQDCELGPDLAGVVGIPGQKDETGAVEPGQGELEAASRRHLGEKAVRELDEDARAVAGLALRTGGAPVRQPLEDGEGLADQGMALATPEVGHQPDAAGVVLECRVVKTIGGQHSATVRS